MCDHCSSQFVFDPQDLHFNLMEAAPRRLAFDGHNASNEWASALRDKVIELLRMPDYPANTPAIAFRGEARDMGDHIRRELVVEAEPGAHVPITMLTPKTGEGPWPVMICLQGHTTGRHISMGEAKYPGDENSLGGDRDFALQAVRQGFAALALELRAFGERNDSRPDTVRRTHELARNDDNRTCKHSAMTALLLGRTLLGERVFDVRRTCDAIAQIPELDADRIYLMGQSGGGTVGWYAAAVEPRLKAVMLASFFGTVTGTIGRIDHCTDNYLPDMLTWFDFPDIAGAFGDTKVLVVMGRLDPLFPEVSVKQAAAHVRSIFSAQGRADAFDLRFGEEGHRFYAAVGWPRFLEMVG